MPSNLPDSDNLDQLVTAVTDASKYRYINPELVRRIGADELQKRPRLKEAVKATKSKLHQVGGAYFDKPIDYERALAQLRQTADFQAACREIMGLHTSTAERLPILERFYTTILAGLADIRVALDIACGLHPLAWPWMPFKTDVTYLAYDIYGDMTAFLAAFMALAGIDGRCQTRDVIGDPPTETADLAFILKTLPVLEQVEKGSAARLLDAVDARYLLVSFPVHSLGGRQKGMAAHYEAQFRGWLNGRSWPVQRFLFATELVFLVQKGSE